MRKPGRSFYYAVGVVVLANRGIPSHEVLPNLYRGVVIAYAHLNWNGGYGDFEPTDATFPVWAFVQMRTKLYVESHVGAPKAHSRTHA